MGKLSIAWLIVAVRRHLALVTFDTAGEAARSERE
jgi:hypothetical protein